MESGDLAQLADPKMKGKYDVEQLHRVVLTASYCVRQSSVWRPSMSEVNVLCLLVDTILSPFIQYKQHNLIIKPLRDSLGVGASNQWP